MSLFLLAFFIVYGGVHFYFFAKFRGAFAPGPACSSALILFLALMVIAPILVRLAERAGYEDAARILAYAGYVWMEVLFLFFSASVALDLFRLAAGAARLVAHRDLPGLGVSGRTAFLTASAISVCISFYGYFEALQFRAERIVIKSAKIPVEIGRIRVVQISDVHLGLIVGEKRLRRIIREIEATKADMLVSTGDLVDGQIDGLSELVAPLREIKPKYGKYAVTGNHEWYAGIDQALNFTRKTGFAVMDGKALYQGGITVAGVSDPASRQMGVFGGTPEKEMLARLPRDKFTLLLKHRPVVEKESPGLYDLQLSGHIHQGQIFPFILVTRLIYPAPSGASRQEGAGTLYVSRGTGTWGPPIRFLAPPEVTVIDLVHGE